MNKLEEAIKILKEGGIVIFPTDTAFGIGCRMDNHEAVEKLFRIRQRPLHQATPVLVSGIPMTRKYWEDLPEKVIALLNKHWPGALTVVYGAKSGSVDPLVCGGTRNIGFRCPDSTIALELINGVNVPILGPSANIHGKPTPYQFADLDPNLTKLVDLVLPGECKTALASTVVDCTKEPFQILRQGSVKLVISY
jgi:L-threonylcarbamoyladenylate synthase